MKICKYHPTTELEYTEVVVTKVVEDELIRRYSEAESCPKCFEEYEQGERWKHDMIEDTPLFNNITTQVDSVIDAQIDER